MAIKLEPEKRYDFENPASDLRVYVNRSITLRLRAKAKKKALKSARTEEGRLNNLRDLIFSELDENLDTLPVSGSLEKIQTKEGEMDAYRLYCFPLDLEYFLTEDDICDALQGKALRLRAKPRTKETAEQMLWCGATA